MMNYIVDAIIDSLFCRVKEVLNYLHSKKILYRDIKLENILVDVNGHIKIIDFGLSKILESGHEFTKSFCGSP